MAITIIPKESITKQGCELVTIIDDFESEDESWQ